uniref:Putative AC transposase n=1 Tax=Rhizophora mucronata TaxID=61149 RepID=A0A2P2JIW6_RHIMU
MDPQILQMHL